MRPIDFQEFMIQPHGFSTFSEGLQAITEVFHALKSVLKKRGLSTAVGDEGGFAPKLDSVEDAIESILEAVKNAGYKAGKEIYLALDVAASEFYNHDGTYTFRNPLARPSPARNSWTSMPSSSANIPSSASRMVARKAIGSIGSNSPTRSATRCSLSATICFVTNVKFLQKGIDTGTANSILVKVNQIGSLTETLDAVQLAQFNKYTAVLSHRSGETEDSTIADIAVATNCGQIKTGSLSRTDRTAKYNQLLRIEAVAWQKCCLRGHKCAAKKIIISVRIQPGSQATGFRFFLVVDRCGIFCQFDNQGMRV